MKKTVAILATIISLVILTTSCSTFHIFGKNSEDIQKQAQKIQVVEDKQSALNQQKIDDMTVLAMGTDDALRKETNADRPVKVAQEINKRVISEGGYSPTITEIKDMQSMVNNLIATNQLGAQALAAKDAQIQGLQSEEAALVKAKQTQVDKFEALASKQALKADATQNELDKYTAYWGLGAIFLGLKTFLLHILWMGIGFVVVFIVLRALSYSNPLAAAIFGIFQSLGAAMIHLIETIIPSSINTLNAAVNDVTSVSNLVNTSIADLKAASAAKAASKPAAPATASAPITNSPAPSPAPVTGSTATPISGSTH